MGVAVALMRHHRGPLSRQSTLSVALVGAMGGGDGGGGSSVAGDNDEAGADGGGRGGVGGEKAGAPGRSRGHEKEHAQEKGALPEGSDPLVHDPWFQLVLCRECMLHGFYEAAEAGLRRLRQGAGAPAAATSDAVWVWTEVLGRVSAAEAYFGGSSDPVSAGRHTRVDASVSSDSSDRETCLALSSLARPLVYSPLSPLSLSL